MRWRDNSLKILAVLISLLLWIYVTNEQNPVTNMTFNVPLVTQDKPAEYVVYGIPETVNVRVKGTRSLIGTLERDDFTARVNLSGIAAGEQELPVQVTSPPGVEVMQITPQTVRFQADKIVQKNVPVVVTLKGNVSDGLQPGVPVLKPPVVSLRGPGKVLNEIKQVGVTLDVSGVADTLEREVAVETGIKDVTVNPDRVTVTVPVTELPVRDLPVRIRLTGEPAAGYDVSGSSVQPSTVQVVGSQDVLQKLTAVSTMVVDITGITGDVEREVVLMLPDGAKQVRPDRVQVKVNITPVETDQPQEEGSDAGNPPQ